MGILIKTKSKEKEPQYFRSATNIPTLNYKVYYMSLHEKILTFLFAFIIGAAVGYLFYGGLAKDEFNNATTTTYILDLIISSVVGFIAGKLFLPIRNEQIINKRQKLLKLQFRDMLEALNTSLGAGKNIVDSFDAVYEDLKVQYEEDAFILKELEIILAGIANNVAIEDVLDDFGHRSGIDDIISFTNVFRICYRKGGNIKDAIRSTHDILNEKMEIAEDIETVVTSSKNEQNIMLVMPVILIAVIKMMSSEFAKNFATVTGVISTTFSIILFIVSYFVGKAVLRIKI